jgi:hypothetical protein
MLAEGLDAASAAFEVVDRKRRDNHEVGALGCWTLPRKSCFHRKLKMAISRDSRLLWFPSCSPETRISCLKKRERISAKRALLGITAVD